MSIMLSQPENVHTGSTPTQPQCQAYPFDRRCSKPATLVAGVSCTGGCSPRDRHICETCYGWPLWACGMCDGTIAFSEPVRLRGNR